MEAIISGQLFYRTIVWLPVVQGLIILGGSYQGGKFFERNYPGTNCAGGNYPAGNCLGVIIWGGSCLGKIIWAAIVLFQYPINPYIYIQKVKNTTNLREFLNTFEESEREYPTFFSKYNFKQPSAFINYAKYSVSSWGTQIWDRVLS